MATARKITKAPKLQSSAKSGPHMVRKMERRGHAMKGMKMGKK